MPGVCSKCGETGDINSVNFCMNCNNFRAKLGRMFLNWHDIDPQIAVDFNSLDAEKKAEFYRTHHALHGKDLALKVLQTTSEQRRRRYTERFVSSRKGVDEADIREKYKRKSISIVNNILTHACSFECPITKRILYIDPEYELSAYYEEEQQYVHTIMGKTTFNRKRQATPKGSDTAKKTKTDVEVIIDLEDEDVAKIVAAKGLLAQDVDQLKHELTQSEPFKEFIATAALARVRETIQDGADAVDTADVVVSTKKGTISVKHTLGKINATKKDVKDTIKYFVSKRKQADEDMKRKAS